MALETKVIETTIPFSFPTVELNSFIYLSIGESACSPYNATDKTVDWSLVFVNADTTAIKSVVKVEEITLDETTFVSGFRQ